LGGCGFGWFGFGFGSSGLFGSVPIVLPRCLSRLRTSTSQRPTKFLRGFTMNRAYSLLTVKAVDDDARIITGMATTPTADRMQDVVEPRGAQFKLPIPFLWQHDSGQPIGHVIDAKVGKGGIEIVAKIAKGVTAEIDRAYALIKAGLVPASRLDSSRSSVRSSRKPRESALPNGIGSSFQP